MNSIGILRYRIFAICSAIVAWPTTDAYAAAPKEFHFPIYGYELSFSVSKAFLSDYWGDPDKMKPELLVDRRPGENSGAILFSNIHMLTGPIWVGNYAALDFSVLLVEPTMEYSGSVATLEQLEEFEKWQLTRPSSYAEPRHYDFSRKTIAGETWLMMTLVEKDTVIIRGNTRSPGRRGDENTLLLFPLGERCYLMVRCLIKEYVPNKTGRWLSDAHKMRDQILDSVVLRKKPN